MNVRPATIGDFVEPITTWNPATKPDDSFIYIDLSAVNQTEKQIASATSTVGAEAPSRARQLVKKGDILVSTVRPNLNGVAAVSEAFDGATASTGFCVLRPRPQLLSSNYLMHWVRSPQFVDLMVKQATGASYPAVSDRIVKGSPIPLPSLDEQRRIAAILDKADAIRRKRKRAVDALDSLTQSIFLKMFGDPIEDPQYSTRQLNDLVNSDRGISYGIVQRGQDRENGTKVLRISDIVDGHITGYGLKQTAPEIADKFRRTKLVGGEIAISIRGTVGRCAVVPSFLSGANVSREIAVIPTAVGRLNPFYLSLIRTDSAQRRLARDVKGVAQSGINLEDLRQLPIIQPPKSEIDHFLKAHSHYQNIGLKSREQTEKFEILSSSLQYRAFSGQL